jgi:MFS family permease
VTGAYGRILRTPGTPRLVVAATTTWIGATMTPVAFLLFAREATGSFASAGLVLGALTAGAGLLAPLRGRLVDRHGADRAVLELTLPGLATDAALILAGRAHAPTALLVAIAFVSGAVVAPVGTGLRTVWSSQLAAPADKQAAYGLMTAIGEVSFFTGPLLAGLLAAQSPTLAVAASAALALAGALAFATTAGARAHGRDAAAAPQGGRVLGSRGMKVVIATATLFGLTFGALDVAFPVLARQEGSTAAAGVLLSALALGLGVTSLVYGARRGHRSAVERYVALTALAALGLVPLLTLPPLPVLVALALLAGACFAPITLTQNATIDEVAPKHVAGQAFALLGSAYAAGSAAGAAVAGTLVDGAGVRAALALACGATLTATAIAAAGFRAR